VGGAPSRSGRMNTVCQAGGSPRYLAERMDPGQKETMTLGETLTNKNGGGPHGGGESIRSNTFHLERPKNHDEGDSPFCCA